MQILAGVGSKTNLGQIHLGSRAEKLIFCGLQAKGVDVFSGGARAPIGPLWSLLELNWCSLK
jgi:hypothetical protein